MAAITAKAVTGNFSVGTSWVGDIAPTTGDTVIIPSGATITVDVNTTIGTSGTTGTDNLTVTGTLAIATGVTLTCAGDVLLNASATWNMGAGSRVEFSGAYRFRYYDATMNIAGTIGSRCFLGSSSTHYVKFEGQSLYRALTLNASYCDFYRIYDGSSYGPQFGGASKVVFTRCKFSYCGRHRHNDLVNTSKIQYVYCDFENGIGSQYIYTTDVTADVPSENYKIANSTFKASATAIAVFWQTGGVNPVIVEDNVFDDVALQITKNHTFKRNFMRTTLASHEAYDNRYIGTLDADAVVDNFHLGESTNPHGFRLAGDGQTATLDGNVSECSSSTADTANHYLPTEQNGNFGTVTIKNAICIGGNAVVIRDIGTANRTGAVIVENITHAYQAGSGDVLLLSENGGEYAYSGTLTMRNNIEYSTGANAKALAKTYSETIAYSGYNCIYDKTFADRYDSTTVTDGSSYDIAENPNFVNASANLASWDGSIGGAGTNASAVAGFLARSSGYVVADLISYLRAAFTPQNTALLDGYDGGYIGAVQPVNPDSIAPVLTGAAGTPTGQTTSTLTVTTDTAGGVADVVVTTSATKPSAAQIQAGSNHTGAAAAYHGQQAVTAAGQLTFSSTGLAASTTYYAHFTHEDLAGNDAAVVSSDPFRTAAFSTPEPEVPKPILTSLSVEINSTTTVTVRVTTDRNDGPLRYVVNNTSVTDQETILNGTLVPVTSIGVQSFSLNGFTAGTSYYLHMVQVGAGGVSNIVSQSFTLASESVTPTTEVDVDVLAETIIMEKAKVITTYGKPILLDHISGDTWIRSWLVNDLSLIGATAKLHLRDVYKTLVATATTANSRLQISTASKRVDLRIDSTEMQLPVGLYAFNLELTTSDGIVRTLERGVLRIQEDTTHA